MPPRRTPRADGAGHRDDLPGAADGSEPHRAGRRTDRRGTARTPRHVRANKPGELAIDMMRRTGIPDPERRAQAFPHELSGGMRQRIMIALALSCSPKILLCDEPTTALDVTVADQVLKLLSKLCDDLGTALVFVTHDLAVVAQTCQRIGVMYSGRIVEKGSVSEVFTSPHHPYTLGLIESAPDFDRPERPLLPIPGTPPNPTDLPPGCAFGPRCGFVQNDCRADRVELTRRRRRPRGRLPTSDRGPPMSTAPAGALQARDIEVSFNQPGMLARALGRRTPLPGAARIGRCRPHTAARRNAGAGRRIRFGQVNVGQRAGRSARAERRNGRLRRHPADRSPNSAAAQAHPDGLSGSRTHRSTRG